MRKRKCKSPLNTRKKLKEWRKSRWLSGSLDRAFNASDRVQALRRWQRRRRGGGRSSAVASDVTCSSRLKEAATAAHYVTGMVELGVQRACAPSESRFFQVKKQNLFLKTLENVPPPDLQIFRRLCRTSLLHLTNVCCGRGTKEPEVSMEPKNGTLHFSSIFEISTKSNA